MKYRQHDRELPRDLVEAELANLVPGQTLYLSDPRRTPVDVQSLDPTTASFMVRVSAFEDTGAEWVFPLWEVSKFLVPEGARTLPDWEQTALRARSRELDREIAIKADAAALARTQADIAGVQAEARAWLTRNKPDLPLQGHALLTGKQPCDHWCAALEGFLQAQGVLQIDQGFAEHYASNPNAGERIKGHRVVLAEMGLVAYQGHVVRDPAIFEGVWEKPKRRAHIVARLAFVRAMFDMLQLTAIPLFRSVYAEEPLSAPRNKGFVSVTFCADVAEALFTSGQKKRFAAKYWQRVPPDRLFMSYFETPQLSRRYQEAEAVLLFDPSNTVF